MVLLVMLTWIKLRQGVAGGGFSYNGKEYENLTTYSATKLLGKDRDEPDCIWPCDAWVLSWHKFASKRSSADIRMFMFMSALFVLVPTLFLSLVTCAVAGLSPAPWFLPVWVATDCILLCIYYGIRFGSELLCAVGGVGRFHPCFRDMANVCAFMFSRCLGTIERELKPTTELQDIESNLRT